MKSKFKKVLIPLVAFLLAFISGCAGITDDSSSDSSNKTASLHIQCPIPSNPALASARSIINFNEDAVAYYMISIIRNDVTLYSKRADSSNDYSVDFDELVPGEYTIRADAYNDEFLLDSIESTEVIFNGDNSITLTFTRKKILNNENIIPYVDRVYDSNSFSTGKYFQVYSNPDDVRIRIDSSTGAKSYGSSYSDVLSLAQTADGSVYYIDDYGETLYKYGEATGVTLPNNTYTKQQDSLYYDFSQDKLWYCQNVSSKFRFFIFDETEKKFNSRYDDAIGEHVSDLCLSYGESADSDITGADVNFVSFAIYGNSLFLAYFIPSASTLKYYIAYFDISGETPVKIQTVTTADIISENCAEITDLQVTAKGELYVLVRQVGRNEYNGENIIYDSLQYGVDAATLNGGSFKPKAFSRGALVKMKYDSSSLTAVKNGGWYNKSRHLEQNGDYDGADSSYTQEMKALDMYGPSYSERGTYFYGPKKIICVKPKELYIVDCGFAIRLADWKRKDDYTDKGSVTTSKTGLSSNVFMHSRIVKVNLEDFALSVLNDEQTPFKELYLDGYYWKYRTNTTDFIQDINISGNIGGFTVNITSSYYMDIAPARFEEEQQDEFDMILANYKMTEAEKVIALSSLGVTASVETGYFMQFYSNYYSKTLSNDERKLYNSLSLTQENAYVISKLDSEDELVYYLKNIIGWNQEQIDALIYFNSLSKDEQSIYLNSNLTPKNAYDISKLDSEEELMEYFTNVVGWTQEQIDAFFENFEMD